MHYALPTPRCSIRKLLLSGLLLPSLLWAGEGVPPPVLASGEWVAVAGESPASLARLLFPSQPATQQRFITALAAENPTLPIDAGGSTPLVPGSVLKMPDWRLLGTSERRAAPPTRKVVADAPSPARTSVLSISAAPPLSWMRLSMTLSPGPVADELTRKSLRLEYRLLSLLNEQLVALGGGDVRAIENAAAAGVAGAGAETPTPPLRLQPDVAATLPTLPQPVAEPLPAPAQVVTPPAPPVVQVPAPQAVVAPAPAPAVLDVAPPPKHLRPAPPEPGGGHDWLPYSVGGGILLLAVAYLRHRRRQQRPVEVPLEHAETVVMEHPLPSASSARRDTPVLNVVDAISSAPQATVMILPTEPDPGDVNPVLELAEIMLSFGRVQGAAETLREYIEANPREALQPWIKLLDIYRQGDMPGEFAAMAERLNQHFNVEIQQWDGRPPPPKRDNVIRVSTLEALPHVCERIVALWGTPECSDYLRQLLRDNRAGERGGFTLPVVQEILLLIDLMADREAAATTH